MLEIITRSLRLWLAAGIEIAVDSDEFQAWYKAFTMFPSHAISEAQYQINAVIQ